MQLQYLNIAGQCLVVVIAYLYIYFSNRHSLATFFKALASGMFLWFGRISSELCTDPQFAKLVMIGLLLGMIADVLLDLRFVFEKIGQKIFILGTLTFLAGHVMYLIALIPYCDNLWLWIIGAVALTVFFCWFIFKRITAEKKMKIVGAVYIGTVTLMATVAAGVFFTAPRLFSLCFFIGGLLFLASDIILILNTFGKKTRKSLRILNVSLYYIGQLMIGLSLQCLRDFI